MISLQVLHWVTANTMFSCSRWIHQMQNDCNCFQEEKNGLLYRSKEFTSSLAIHFRTPWIVELYKLQEEQMLFSFKQIIISTHRFQRFQLSSKMTRPLTPTFLLFFLFHLSTQLLFANASSLPSAGKPELKSKRISNFFLTMTCCPNCLIIINILYNK